MPDRRHLKPGRKSTPRRHPSMEVTKHARFLTVGEVQRGRVDVAIDMVELLAQDGATLPPTVRQTLRALYGGLRDLRRALRDLP